MFLRTHVDVDVDGVQYASLYASACKNTLNSLGAVSKQLGYWSPSFLTAYAPTLELPMRTLLSAEARPMS